MSIALLALRGIVFLVLIPEYPAMPTQVEFNRLPTGRLLQAGGCSDATQGVTHARSVRA